MHPADIKALMEKKGLTQTSIAKAVSGRNGKPVTQSAVFQVIHGMSRSNTIAAFMAKALGEPVTKLWPNRYPVLEAAERHSATPSRQNSSSQRKAA